MDTEKENKPSPQDDASKQPAENTTDAPQDDENALEGGIQGAQASAAEAAAAAKAESTKPTLKEKLSKYNFYLIIFIFLFVIAGAIIIIAYLQGQKASTATIKTQNLTQSALEKVAASDATVGDSGQILNVQSSAVFAGKVLIRKDLEIAGNLQLGGTIALTSLTVSGTSALGQVSVSKDLAVAGNAGIQGSLSVAKGIQVNGSGTFSGAISAPQITTSSLQVAGDLILTHHIVAGGSNPGRTNGPALGGGGTASVSGSDTSGTITINTGSTPTAGCFIFITFAQAYSTTPHVLVTKIGLATANLNSYVNRSATGFSVCTASNPSAGTTYNFDYFVVS